ncbi:class IIb bacteriocin, lactobin A/cerein 7B family [Streptococcus ruminantium]|uniref:Class IIb bacteriocin, lactobin A/cerein 7B family n=1 Tax=Streptococcus ruminantium TaxID=1917441 RepID=A0A2Z5TJW9_9STRE|nr:class IIb bacteriocin, lactobin A/cerein 7B family [Streptococcus ruminantium]MDQ8766338.1 class IIb bacteriocin, lactobin A/cerein 7B family [Streptococcus ruminantium]MDQ8779383.1 class IIb bacteriocin, lactobin A/cerein 7B family [Streptococcus ruminantium]BBA91717.1 class IIb bacteriocin, lactobin A/cerein 7B family [Streptococcus ruminantium]BDD37816.1 hypothetical protein GUT183_00540 [Streptococcus ruminantium]
MDKYNSLTEQELFATEGGLEPITVAIGIGTLLVSSIKIGYDFGKDLARRKR